MTVWCWVKDLSTGHRFDLPLHLLDDMVERGAVREIEGRRRRSANPRPMKPFVSLGTLVPRATGRRPA